MTIWLNLCLSVNHVSVLNVVKISKNFRNTFYLRFLTKARRANLLYYYKAKGKKNKRNTKKREETSKEND